MSQEKIERWNEVDGNLDNGEKLQAFLDSTTDAYAILQLRRTDETVYERFESYEALKRQGKEPNIDHYDVVYVAPLSSYTDQTAMLEGLYTKFNVERPEDFRGHSLSVSDIVALKTDAVVSFYRLSGASGLYEAGELPEKCRDGDGGRLWDAGWRYQ